MIGQRGVSLMEILISLGIVSTLSAIAYPAVADWSRSLDFRSEVSQLVCCLHRAKIEAVKTNSFVVVEARSNGYSIFVDNSRVPGQAGDWIRQPEERLIVACTLKNGISLTSNFSNPANTMRFSGRPGIKAGRFILTDAGGRSMAVILSASGRVRVE
ncbi:MAG: GspH/FimT family pseudopilin [Desulfocapsaceae bacterium]|nr:GspH/FimT family pseudopilin [Desulfocapsaceae bacterium]